jgi:release factor glutamine methyltransferase
VSEDALAIARRNVHRLNAGKQVRLVQSDLLENLPEPVDVVAANLPYITSTDMSRLDAGIRKYEPHLALEGGQDGLDMIRRLLVQLASRLKPGGVIFLEIGSNQGETTLALVHELLSGAVYVGLRQDYHGLDRLVVIGT